MDISILYEDDDLLVCQKPPGILSQDSPEENLPQILREQGRPYIGVVHRLDRNVGGIIIYAKSPEICAKLSAMVAERSFVKEYLAITEQHPAEESGSYIDYLFKDSRSNKVFVVKKQRKGVKEAALHYRVVEKISLPRPMSLVWVSLITGRSHQIRVQFASRKTPLVGDGKYGSKDNHTTEALWAYHVRFTHPVSQKIMDFRLLPPDGYPWNLFHKELNL